MTRRTFDVATLALAAAFTTNMTELLNALDVPVTPGSRAAMWARLSALKLDTTHWVRSPRTYDDEQLGRAVAASSSVAEVLRRLGIRPAGGSHFHISRRIRSAGLDTSHFVGAAARRGPARPLKPPEQILVVLTPGAARTKRPQLVRAMLLRGRPYVCASCGLDASWQGAPLTLAVDHVNGDWLDNRLENLRFLCPNCHAQTSTWCRRKSSLTDP